MAMTRKLICLWLRYCKCGKWKMYQSHLMSLIKQERPDNSKLLSTISWNKGPCLISLRANLAAANSAKQHQQTYSALPNLVASFPEALWGSVIPCPDIPGVLEHDWSSPQCFSSQQQATYPVPACLPHPPDTLVLCWEGQPGRTVLMCLGRNNLSFKL